MIIHLFCSAPCFCPSHLFHVWERKQNLWVIDDSATGGSVDIYGTTYFTPHGFIFFVGFICFFSIFLDSREESETELFITGITQGSFHLTFTGTSISHSHVSLNSVFIFSGSIFIGDDKKIVAIEIPHGNASKHTTYVSPFLYALLRFISFLPFFFFFHACEARRRACGDQTHKEA